jgi:hypothetical protein
MPTHISGEPPVSPRQGRVAEWLGRGGLGLQQHQVKSARGAAGIAVSREVQCVDGRDNVHAKKTCPALFQAAPQHKAAGLVRIPARTGKRPAL